MSEVSVRRRWKQFWCNHKWIKFFGGLHMQINLRLCDKCVKVQYAKWHPEINKHVWRRYI